MLLICVHNIFFSACLVFWFVYFQLIFCPIPVTQNYPFTNQTYLVLDSTHWLSESPQLIITLKLQSVPQISYCMTHRMTPLIYIKCKPIYHFLWYLSDAILSFWSFDSPSFHSLSLYLNRVQYTQRTKSHNSFGTSWWWVNHHHFHFWVNYVFTKCLRSYRKNIIISAILSINTISIIHWAFTHIKRSILPSN